MNCKEIQEKLLTDYLDAEADERLEQAVERHLASCPACREFLAAVRQTTVTPFTEAHEEDILDKEAVWQEIKGRIQEEGPSAPATAYGTDWLAELKKLIWFPRPALALAALLLIVAAFAFRFYGTHPAPVQELASQEVQTSTDDLTDAWDEFTVAAADEDEDYGTAIEEYFL